MTFENIFRRLRGAFGTALVGGSLKLAQLADALSPGRSQDQLDGLGGLDRLASGEGEGEGEAL